MPSRSKARDRQRSRARLFTQRFRIRTVVAHRSEPERVALGGRRSSRRTLRGDRNAGDGARLGIGARRKVTGEASRLLSSPTSHGTLKNPRKRDPAAAHRFAIERIVRKAREETRDRDAPSSRASAIPAHWCAPEPKARWRFGVAAMSKRRGRRTVPVAVGGADAQRDRRACRQRDAAELERLGRHAVAELVRALEAQELLDRASRSARALRSAAPSRPVLEQRHQAVADQVGRRLVAGVEQEDAVVQQLASRSAARHRFALDQPRQHVASGSPGCARRRATRASR